MKSYAVIVTMLLVIVLAGFALAQQTDKEVAEGGKPYIPSRLEWMALEMNANFLIDDYSVNNFSLYIYPLHYQDTIVICVRYSPSVNLKAMNYKIDNARKAFNARYITKMGWTWLKLNEDIDMLREEK